MKTMFLLLLILSVGIYEFLCGVLHLPAAGYTKAFAHVSENKESGKFLDTVVYRISANIARWIHLNEDRRSDLTVTLKSANIHLTPEMYYARIITHFLFKMVPGLIALPFSPIATLAVALYAAYGIFGELKSTNKRIRQKRDKIEAELSRFVNFIYQKIRASKDVVSILSSYVPSAEKELREELEITIADMRSGNQEQALTRLDQRIGSTMLREVILGLQAVLRGDNNAEYFSRLSYDFKKHQIQQLKMGNMKRPRKVQLYTVIILGCFILTAFAILGIYAYTKANNINIL